MSKHILQVGNSNIKLNSDMICLNDIWKASKAAGMAEGKLEPKRWAQQPVAKKSGTSGKISYSGGPGYDLINEIAKVQKVNADHLLKSVSGKGGGTYAELNVALGYASYLSAELQHQINTTYLRAKSGDVTLADEIVDRASDEDQVLHLMRTAGKVQRKQFTGALSKHEVDGKGYAICTDAIYTGAFNACAKELRKLKNLPEKTNVREHMTVQEIIQTAHAEMIAVRNMDDTKARGTRECAAVCEAAARKVASI